MSATLTLSRDDRDNSYASSLTCEPLRITTEWGYGARDATSTRTGSQKREQEFQDSFERLNRFLELPTNWDGYGGVAAKQEPSDFAADLLTRCQMNPDIVAPLVQPISGGVFLEWRFGDMLLFFEADDESVLCCLRNAFGEETTEDDHFDCEKAYERVVKFHENAA